jgi:hypothetical protein
VLQHEREVLLVGLPVPERRSVRLRLEVLRQPLRGGGLLRRHRLRERQGLQEQPVRRRVPFERRLPGRAVLQHGHGSVRHLRLHERRSVRSWQSLLRRSVRAEQHLLRRQSVRRGQVLQVRELRAVLQVIG